MQALPPYQTLENFFHLVLNYSILKACQTELEKVCDMLIRLAHTLVGHVFDLGSPREVADVSLTRRVREFGKRASRSDTIIFSVRCSITDYTFRSTLAWPRNWQPANARRKVISASGFRCAHDSCRQIIRLSASWFMRTLCRLL